MSLTQRTFLFQDRNKKEWIIKIAANGAASAQESTSGITGGTGAITTFTVLPAVASDLRTLTDSFLSGAVIVDEATDLTLNQKLAP